MTAMIHLDNEMTDRMILKIRLTADNFFDRADLLYARSSNMSWEGSSRDAFLFDLYRCTSTLKRLSDSLDQLGFQLAQETDQWYQAASRLSY